MRPPEIVPSAKGSKECVLVNAFRCNVGTVEHQLVGRIFIKAAKLLCTHPQFRSRGPVRKGLSFSRGPLNKRDFLLFSPSTEQFKKSPPINLLAVEGMHPPPFWRLPRLNAPFRGDRSSNTLGSFIVLLFFCCCFWSGSIAHDQCAACFVNRVFFPRVALQRIVLKTLAAFVQLQAVNSWDLGPNIDKSLH